MFVAVMLAGEMNKICQANPPTTYQAARLRCESLHSLIGDHTLYVAFTKT